MVKVGVMIDKNSRVGRHIDMALSDFYAEHASYRTRLSLCSRDSQNDVVAAASAALDLMENEQVYAIIGPEWSSQAKFVIDLGARAQVPIISFSATSPSLSPAQNIYFVRTTYDDSVQVKAIAAVVQIFGWKEVVPLYEDTEYGNGLIPCITDAFQEIDTRVPYRSVIHPSAHDIDILNELIKLMTMQTRVFLVHMTASLGSRLFLQANKAGMLNDETVWIVTDGLTSLLDPVGYRAKESMQGVIGVRPHLPMSKRLERFKKKYLIGARKLNLFALWGYDTVSALANAVEMAWWNSSKSRNRRRTRPKAGDGVNLSALAVSEMGPEILRWIRNSTVNGLMGRFQLRTKSNVSNFTKKENGCRTSKDNLMPPIWPGGTRQQPKGWVIPTVTGKKMKIGVPVTQRFSEFFKIVWDPQTDVPTYSGFSYDVFLEVLKELPFALPYEFKPFMNASRQSAGSYDDLLYQITLGVVDAVVADMTIIANRSNYVDFALPYSESGVSMLVAMKDDKRRNMWIFLKPLKWNLWLTTGLAFVFKGFIVWVLERQKNEDFNGSPGEQFRLCLWFSFSTLVFAHRG
ncbi:hypothetical protein CDL15_Pgr017668 [Punica granatum]|uniref:Ionotropic glutamate receptor C-terminal domain-containing protein n=1 Tax=Punica granatum TaxID=22663 RepID=A0A218WWG2_PUNGR|nr:hypothetical protein CDL15_Pgr017668 [Punica granatum]